MRSDTDLKIEGMQILAEQRGCCEVARFILLIKREQLDYTQWQEEQGLLDEAQLDILNEETIAAIQDVNQNRNMSRSFNSVKELMEGLDADDQLEYSN